MASWNDTVIDDFRAKAGVLGGHWEGKRVVLLHAVGRRSGKEFVNPLVAAPDGDDFIVCGSQGGAPTDPQWIANVEATEGPVTVEFGADTVKADHTVIRPTDPAWESTYATWRAYWPDAANYEAKTDRKFPLVRLHLQG
jgi:deazaflavin-dependent oxidoreductase (nitroreductase family)